MSGVRDLGWAFIEIASTPSGHRFFVDAVDAKGSRMELHSCSDHATATALAREACNALEVDFDRIREVPVSPDPETMQLFDRMMGHARLVGAEMADTIIAGAPPPWEETWFESVYQNCIEQSAVAFKTKWPDLSDTIIVNMQVRFCDGFEARMKSVLGGGHFHVPETKGGAN